MHIALIWAMSRNRVIGRGSRLPWRLPKDMQFFVTTTMGKPVIMGRRTFETMKAPLAGRTNIVITRNADYQRQGVRIAGDLDAALTLAEDQCLIDGRDEIMVVGGADIYRLALPVATRLYVTLVDADVAGDTFFPEIDFHQWREMKRESFPADAANSYPFSIAVFERPDPPG